MWAVRYQAWDGLLFSLNKNKNIVDPIDRLYYTPHIYFFFFFRLDTAQSVVNIFPFLGHNPHTIARRRCSIFQDPDEEINYCMYIGKTKNRAFIIIWYLIFIFWVAGYNAATPLYLLYEYIYVNKWTRRVISTPPLFLSLSIADGIWYVSFYFFFFFVHFFEFGTGRSRPRRTMRTAYQQHTIPAIEKERDREKCGTLIYTKILNRVVDVYHSPARELLPMFAH